MNPRLNHTKKARQRYFLLRIDSYTGKDTTRDQHEILDEEGWNVQEIDTLYAVIRIGGDGAEIAHDGYRSLAEAQKAWPHALPRQRLNTNGPQERNSHDRSYK